MTLRLTRLARRSAVAAAVGAVACGGSDKTPTDNGPPTPVPTAVTLNGSTASATIAATCAARTQGLSGVTTLAADAGMLFVFADDRQRAFWMKDTPIALSIAFMDANKKVVFLDDMAPNTLTQHGGLNAPQMRYALETRQGWFASHGVTVGMAAAFTVPSALTIEPDCP